MYLRIIYIYISIIYQCDNVYVYDYLLLGTHNFRKKKQAFHFPTPKKETMPSWTGLVMLGVNGGVPPSQTSQTGRPYPDVGFEFNELLSHNHLTQPSWYESGGSQKICGNEKWHRIYGKSQMTQCHKSLLGMIIMDLGLPCKIPQKTLSLSLYIYGHIYIYIYHLPRSLCGICAWTSPMTHFIRKFIQQGYPYMPRSISYHDKLSWANYQTSMKKISKLGPSSKKSP